MKRLYTLLSLPALLATLALPARAQQTSGVIDYEVSAKIDPRRMRGGGGESDGGEAQIVTFNQHFYFTPAMGRLETERPAFGGGFNRGNTAAGGGQDANRPRRFIGGRGNNSVYVDLANKKYLQVMTLPGDEGKTYYSEDEYTPAADVKVSDKTKMIAGYTCKKATLTLRDETYTVWFTKDLPFSYSPVNGLLPDSSGVVLAAESSNRSFTAKKITLKPVEDSTTALPANAEKVSQEKMRELRREMMQKFRERQNGN